MTQSGRKDDPTMLRDTTGRLPDPRVLRDRTDGAVAIEYAILAIVVGLGIVSGLIGVKNRINSDVDAISYNIANSVVAPTQANRTVSSTTTANLVVNGITYAQTRTNYSDGSAQMVQIPSDPVAATYAKGVYVYDTNGALTSMTFTRGDGSLVNSVAYSTIRPGVSVSTLTDQSGVPYTFQTYASINGAVETDSQYMIDNGGRTDVWTQRIQTYDNTNPNATTYSAVCTYQGGRTAAC